MPLPPDTTWFQSCFLYSREYWLWYFSINYVHVYKALLFGFYLTVGTLEEICKTEILKWVKDKDKLDELPIPTILKDFLKEWHNEYIDGY